MTGPMTGPMNGLPVVEVGAVAHGGHFVARLPDGRVVFVRHALPGERVRIRLTEEGARFCRADAIEVLEASPHRVQAPCPLAHPDGCGGCDFQHVALPEQRRLKTAVVREQLRRLAGVDWAGEVEPVPNPMHPVDDGLRWRTRMRYVDLPGGRRGLRKHRSHEVVEVEDCLIAAPGAREAPAPARSPSAAATPPRARVTGTGRTIEAVEDVTETVLGRDFTVAAQGFWQVHPAAPGALVEAVLQALAPRPGEHVLDLYAGVGLFAAFLAGAVGERGSVTAVEGDRAAARHGTANLRDLPWARLVRAPVDRWLAHRRRPADLVVLDPPRTGARRRVVEAVAALQPRAVCYVACDPAALARDAASFSEAGYHLVQLRGLDLFPMTHHVECVALFEPA